MSELPTIWEIIQEINNPTSDKAIDVTKDEDTEIEPIPPGNKRKDPEPENSKTSFEGRERKKESYVSSKNGCGRKVRQY